MDAQAILEIRPALTAYLQEFDGCFANVRSQRHLATYVAGQLIDLQRKRIEPMADEDFARSLGALRVSVCGVKSTRRFVSWTGGFRSWADVRRTPMG